MTRDEKELLKQIDEKLDKVVELTIRHDEKIKSQDKQIKVIMGVGVSVFLLLVGAIVAAAMR